MEETPDGGEAQPTSGAPTKREILELIEKLREPFTAMKVRQYCKERWSDMKVTDADQESLGAMGETVDRGFIFEYSEDEYRHNGGRIGPESEGGSSSATPTSEFEEMYEVKWSTYTQCPVDKDCDDRTAWAIGIEADEWVDTELAEWSDRFTELLDNGDMQETEHLYLGMKRVCEALDSATESGADGAYKSIHALSDEGSDHWQGDDADTAHEQYGGAIKQAGDNHAAMAQILRDQANNDLALQITVHYVLADCVKQVHNTIRQKTYLDHFKEWDVLGDASMVLGTVGLVVSTQPLAVVGFALGALSYAGVEVKLDITIERELKLDQFETIKDDVMAVLDDTESMMEDSRADLKKETETLFDPYFYEVASGNPAYIPGGGV